MEYTYEQAREILTSSGKFRIDLGLDRISNMLALLNNPQDKLKCIHVAGTNGKGSVCSIIASVLKESGQKVGLYTSPHIYKYTERIKINRKNISDDVFSKYVFDITNLAEKNNILLTEFETLTAVMFKYFKDENVDTVVLETGLGGRFDATNIIKSNLCSIITHIDLDHTDRLGDTKEKIAFEKAGIIKPGCPVITSEGYEVIKDRADECNSLLIIVNPIADTSKLSLKGTYQQENLALALEAISLVFPDISQNIIDEGLKKVEHPCRFEYLKDKNILIDGAHNPNGIRELKKSLDLYFPKMKRQFVFGCLDTKDYPEMIRILFNENDEIYFYHFNNPHSVPVEKLKAACKYKAKEFTSLNDLPKNNETLTIICGSFYMMNEILEPELSAV